MNDSVGSLSGRRSFAFDYSMRSLIAIRKVNAVARNIIHINTLCRVGKIHARCEVGVANFTWCTAMMRADFWFLFVEMCVLNIRAGASGWSDPKAACALFSSKWKTRRFHKLWLDDALGDHHRIMPVVVVAECGMCLWAERTINRPTDRPVLQHHSVSVFFLFMQMTPS